MRITKDLTLKIVNQLVKPITDKINENSNSISGIIKDYILKDCPIEILDLWHKNSNWVNTSSYVSFSYLGQSSSCSFKKDIPIKSKHIIIEDREIAEQVQKIINCNLDLKKKHRELSTELEVTILKLATFARIKDQFPEAAQLLPDENKRTEIALNIQDVRNKLKNIP